MFSISKSVGEDTSVVSLVRLPTLGDAQEDEVLLPVRPELESLHLRQVDVSSEQTIQPPPLLIYKEIPSPEPFNGGGRVTKHFQLHVGIFFFIGKKFILRIFQELRCTGQTSRLQGLVLSGGELLLVKNCWEKLYWKVNFDIFYSKLALFFSMA